MAITILAGAVARYGRVVLTRNELFGYYLEQGIRIGHIAIRPDGKIWVLV